MIQNVPMTPSTIQCCSAPAFDAPSFCSAMSSPRGLGSSNQAWHAPKLAVLEDPFQVDPKQTKTSLNIYEEDLIIQKYPKHL